VGGGGLMICFSGRSGRARLSLWKAKAKPLLCARALKGLSFYALSVIRASPEDLQQFLTASVFEQADRIPAESAVARPFGTARGVSRRVAACRVLSRRSWK
jgi:hypothetical protein